MVSRAKLAKPGLFADAKIPFAGLLINNTSGELIQLLDNVYTDIKDNFVTI